METIEQGLRRIFKNAPHIYAECERCANGRPNMKWNEQHSEPISGSHWWWIDSFKDESWIYWNELNNKVNAGEQIGPDYPLPPDSPIRQREVGNWYKCINGHISFIDDEWYECVGPTNKFEAFLNKKGVKDGYCQNNHIRFDLSNPLPHNPKTNPTLEDMEPKPEQAPEPTKENETRIQLNEEKFAFIKNSCVVRLDVIHKEYTYRIYYNEPEFDQDNHETLLELQLEAVRFAKKRLNEAATATLE